jgi:hypothetical protein
VDVDAPAQPPSTAIHRPGDLALALLQHVTIGVGRQHDRRVPELVLDVLQRHALRQQERVSSIGQHRPLTIKSNPAT